MVVILLTLSKSKNGGHFANFEHIEKMVFIVLILNKYKNVGYFADFE